MVREPTLDDPTTVAVRLDAATIKAVDAYADAMRQREPGIAATRSDAIRTLILRGLKATG